MKNSKPYINLKANPEALTNNYDIVVIGSGLAGLSCALELSRNGFKVAVFENHYIPGGYAHNFKRKDYIFDVSLHHIGALEEKYPIGCVLDKLGVLDKIEIKPKKILYTAEFPEFNISIPNGYAQKVLIEKFPHEKQNIELFIEHLVLIKRHTMERWVDPNYNVSMDEYLPARYKDKTFEELVNQFISDPNLKNVLGQFWMYIGLPPQKCNASFSSCLLASQLLEGSWDIKGGGAALSQAMVQSLNELGGVCFTSAKVKKIITENGIAKGVILENGSKINSSIVISNADPDQTFNELIQKNELRNIFHYRLSKMESSLSAYTLYLGLDCPPSKIGIPEGVVFHNYHNCLEEAYEKIKSSELSETDWCLTSYENSKICSFPEGTGVVSFAELAPISDWLLLSEGEYKAKKETTLNLLLKKYENRFPGLSSHIVIKEFATPKTMKRYSLNKSGAIYGCAQILSQSGNKRLSNITPIKSLYLTGAWTLSGGGYEGAIMSGIQTASVVKENNIPPKNVPMISLKRTNSAYTSCDWSCLRKVKVYPKDVSSGNVVDLNTFLKYLDRSRIDLGEKILGLNEKSSLLSDNNIQVYSIQLKMSASALLGDKLEIQSHSYRKNPNISIVSQSIHSEKTNEKILDAYIELVILDKKNQLTTFSEEISPPFDKEPLFNKIDIMPPLKKSDYYFYQHYEKVYTEDTDLLGITFHASYMRFIESTIYEFLEENCDDTTLWKYWSYKKLFIRFFNSSTIGDNLKIIMGIKLSETNDIIVNQKIFRQIDNTVILEANCEIELLGEQGSRISTPKELIDLCPKNRL